MKMLFVFLAMLAMIAIVGGYVPPEENVELAFGVNIDDTPVTQEEVNQWVDGFNKDILNIVFFAVVLVLVALGLLVLFKRLSRPMCAELDNNKRRKAEYHERSLRDVQELKYEQLSNRGKDDWLG